MGTNSEVPFKLFKDNLIIVKATIGSVKNVNFILDTGTNPSAITRDVADRLRLNRKAESLQTLSGTIQTQSVTLPGLQIGPIYVESIRAVLQDLSLLERGLGISLGGIVGLDILSRGNFTIDYRRKQILFGLIGTTEKSIRFESQLPLLTVEATIEGQEVRLLIDSGTPGLLLYRNRLQLVQDQTRFDPNAFLSIPGSVTHIRWVRAVVKLGGNNLGTHSVAIADTDSKLQNGFDGLLGFREMGFSEVSFDFGNGLFGWD